MTAFGRTAPPEIRRRIPSYLSTFRYFQRVVNFNTQVANCALELCVAQQELHSTEIAGSFVDQCGFCSTQRVSSVQPAVQTDF